MGILSGQKVLEEVTSAINGKIRAVKSLGLGTYIQAEGLTQSGGVVNAIWKGTLSKAAKLKKSAGSCLILGLGGGSAAKFVKKYWPKAKITGVDIDPIMVRLGQKYLGLSGVSVVIKDANDFAKSATRNSQKYDIVLVDIYRADKVPGEFEQDDFLIRVKGLLAQGGIAIFNRLYFGEKRPEAMRFAAKLEAVFPNVEYFHPEANVMFLCYN